MITTPHDEADLRVDCRNELGETPLWDAATGTLYWIDVVAPGRVFHWQLDSGAVDFWQFDDLVTGLNLAARGELLVQLKTEILHFDPKVGRIHKIFSLPASGRSMRFNDGRCDSAGRLWVGTMVNNIDSDGTPLNVTEHTGQILMIGDGITRNFAAGLGCPNAICWSPDGGTFYIADSCDGWLYAYRFDSDAMSISDRRAFFYLESLGVPDGAAVDQDGYIWNARWGAGVVARISPEGRLDRIVQVAASQATACCFGGHDRRTLFITSARFALTPEQLSAQPFAGGVFAISVDVAGLELSPFCGVNMT